MDYLQFQELYHHGIKGQKWGIRNYTNPDGTLTEEGKIRYNNESNNMRFLGDKIAKAELAKDYIETVRGNTPNNVKTLLASDDYQKVMSYINEGEKATNKLLNKYKDKNAKYFRISMDDGYDYIITSADSDIKGYGHINFSLVGKTIKNNNPKFTYDTKSGFKQLK